MTRDDIIRLALEAGFDVNDHGEWVGDKDGKCLERFASFVAAVKPTDEDCSSVAALVAAAEREACAKVCDGIRYGGYCPPEDGAAREYYNSAAAECADAIRARGEP
jgi:hypothetical protein